MARWPRISTTTITRGGALTLPSANPFHNWRGPHGGERYQRRTGDPKQARWAAERWRELTGLEHGHWKFRPSLAAPS